MAGAATLPMASVLIAVLENGSGALPYAATVIAIFAVLAALTWRGGRWGPVTLAVVALLYLVFLVSFGTFYYLHHPSSWATFVGAGLDVLGVATMLVAFILRERLPVRFVPAIGVLGLLVVIVGAGASIAADDPVARPGDVLVSMRPDGSAFACRVPHQLPAGSRSVFVRNTDTVPHRFVLGRSAIDVRAGGTARAELRIDAGQVTWRCVYANHTDVTGTSIAQ